MKPQNATADVRPDPCDVWAPTQVQTRALNAAVQITGLPAAKVDVHTTYLGGGFGRKLDADYVNDAVDVSKAIGKPVKVTWTREDDVQHDFYRAMSVNALHATLGRKAGSRASRIRWSRRRSCGAGTTSRTCSCVTPIPNTPCRSV